MMSGHNPEKRLTQRELGRQAEFFAGAMACVDAMGMQIPPLWIIFIMSGRDILEEEKKNQKPDLTSVETGV